MDEEWSSTRELVARLYLLEFKNVPQARLVTKLIVGNVHLLFFRGSLFLSEDGAPAGRGPKPGNTL